MTQFNLVLDYVESHGSITRAQASNLGIKCLNRVITDIRRCGKHEVFTKYHVGLPVIYYIKEKK